MALPAQLYRRIDDLRDRRALARAQGLLFGERRKRASQKRKEREARRCARDFLRSLPQNGRPAPPHRTQQQQQHQRGGCGRDVDASAARACPCRRLLRPSGAPLRRGADSVRAMAPSRATLRVLPPPPVFAFVVSAVLVLAFALTTTPALVSGYLQDDETPEEVLGLAGGEVSLPCGSSQFPGLAEDDEPILVLWFREGSATPILSADARRGGGLANAKVWKDDAWEARFTLRPVGLVLSSLRADQHGVYMCRVDFRQAQTLNRLVRLTVTVPPRAVVIRDSRGRPLNGSVTAIDGQSLSLLCTAPGGRPPAVLSWWRDGHRLEDVLVPVGDGTGDAASQLAVGPLGRRDLHAQLVCRASNNNISEPLSASVVIDLILGPTSVSIVGATHSLEAGRPGQLRCVASGSRPPAQLSWWKGSQRLAATTTTTEASGAADGPASSSTLTLTPSVEDDGRQIACRALNERLPHATVEDVTTIRVLYKPQLVVRLGNRLRQSSILENHDVYLECSVAANPPASEISWLFEGRDLQTNTSAGIIVSNRSLVLQKVGRSARGHYHCVAANSLGQSRSEPLFLRVQFAPVCHESQKLIYGAARHEPLQVTCDVDADPPEVTFHWHLNHSMETAIPHSMQGATRSVATFIARSEADYGALSCEARNSVGPQRRPCLFSVVPAGPPEPPGLCALANQTEEAFQVRCIEGHHGGLPQHFVLEIHDSGGRFRGNMTSPMPNFEVSDLPSGSEFVLVVYASNGKGRSPPVLLTASTLPAAAESLLHQGPDASWQIKFSPVLAVLMALVLGFALLAFVVVAAVRLWSRHSFHKDANGPGYLLHLMLSTGYKFRLRLKPRKWIRSCRPRGCAWRPWTRTRASSTPSCSGDPRPGRAASASPSPLYRRGARDRLRSLSQGAPQSPGSVHTCLVSSRECFNNCGAVFSVRGGV